MLSSLTFQGKGRKETMVGKVNLKYVRMTIQGDHKVERTFGGGSRSQALGQVPLATCIGQVFNPTKSQFSCL